MENEDDSLECAQYIEKLLEGTSIYIEREFYDNLDSKF